MSGWGKGDPTLTAVVWEQTDVCLKVYSDDPSRVLQDANNERRISQGGYANRQLEELLQNALDAARLGGGRVEVLLTREALYVANDGEPFDTAGVRSVMASDISTKSDDRIGKFGIGFKSILAISDRPKVLSRSVSFAFDKEWSEATLRDAGYDVEYYPAMRLAKTIDADLEAAKDVRLAELMAWASTVIVAPLSVPFHEISKRLYDFPPEFILFSPHLSNAVLRNEAEADPDARNGRKGRNQRREISQETGENGIVTLRVKGMPPTRWATAHRVHTPSPQALDDGGHIAARAELEIRYAAPLPPGAKLGTFWAYFPTHFTTTLSGLINAPWKLSDDRTGLLGGRFNAELLDLLPELVGEAIQVFSGTEDAADVLDLLPARGLESRNWVDQVINEPTYDHLRRVPSLPDGRGILHVPRELRWVNDATAEWLATWAEIPGAPLDEWVHLDAYSTAERRNKVDRLLRPRRLLTERGTESAAGLEVWLEALVKDATTEQSASAIALAAMMLEQVARDIHDPVQRREAELAVRRARIVRLENGELTAPHRGKVFVRVEGDDQNDVLFVDPALAARPGVREQLNRLGVVVMDRTGELHALIANAKSLGVRAGPGVWEKIWEILRELPHETGIRILGEEFGQPLDLAVRVKTGRGAWVPVSQAFLAGTIVPADGSRDREFLIDPHFHRADESLLREFGAVEAPTRRFGAPREPWLDEYEQMASDAFIANQKGAKPDRTKLVIEGQPPPWPLQVVTAMSLEASAAVTAHLIAYGLDVGWTVRHRTNASYGHRRIDPPEAWFVRKYGQVETSFGFMRPNRVVRASEMVDSNVLPALEVSDRVAQALHLKEDPADYSANDWVKLKSIADQWTANDEDDRRRGEFYSWLPGQIQPETLVVRVGRNRQHVSVKNIGITTDPTVYESLLEAQIPALLIANQEDADRFLELWSMTRGSDLLQEEVIAEPAGEPAYLTDIFPPLKLRLDPASADLKLQPTARLVKMVATPNGQVARPIRARRESDTIFVTAEDARQRLSQISDVLDLGLDAMQITKILDEIEATATNERRAKIKNAAGDDERLIEAVGLEALRRAVPSQALQVLEGRQEGASDQEIAALARSVHGIGILKQLRAALEENGLQPPKEWAGRRLTRQWVASLGFPSDWAGFPSSTRPAVEMIDGPAELSELHDYQVFVTDRIKSLLRGIGPDRGMLSLPTGAGKTRVTVEALVNAVRENDLPYDAPLLWIAQTDELCEQAAETWAYVWRAIGARGSMRLGRLWANNEVPEEPATLQLVIATIDKLRSIVDRATDEYDWLRAPSIVVIDEAHASITSSYNAVLEWVGRAPRGRSKGARKPLIGLTATPFRGVDSDEETKRLANRYDQNRLDRGAFLKEDPYEELQQTGVLAKVRHQRLDGVDVTLTAGDVDEITRMSRLPSTVSERLGADVTRTLRIVDSIERLPEDWTVLAFTPSVESSRVLAALLSHRGIPAVSISADTDIAARRHHIGEFKAGRVRVLTNFNVLTQGFDAPKVQAVYLARPTFSPNVYQQMIGRGLRGPLNGGSEEVLIVNVRDNFAQFGELLAFNKFEYLWRRQ